MKAPIGVFDSGVGGLSILQALQRHMPAEDFVYMADSAHAPYGERDAALFANGNDGADQVLVQAHAAGHTVHDEAKSLNGHGG